MSAVRYRSRKSGEVVTFASRQPRLESDDRYVRVDDAATASEDDDGRPNVSAQKSDWETYATSLGIDVDGKTKDEIVAAVDAHEQN